MSICETKYHGRIEYSDDTVLDLPAGLLGFEEHTRFLPVEVPATRPIIYLQSLLKPETCFITLPVLVADPVYQLAMSLEDIRFLGLDPGITPRIGCHVICLAVITIQTGRPTTANLMAPVVVNLDTRRGLQIISTDQAHSHRYEFLPSKETATCS